MSGPGTTFHKEPPDKGEPRRNIVQENIVHISDDEMNITTENEISINSQQHNIEVTVNKTKQKQCKDSSNVSTNVEQKDNEKVNSPIRSKFIDLTNRYAVNSKGPFILYVEHSSENLGRLHPMKLGEKLLNIGEDEIFIEEINVIGRNRVKIAVTSAGAANRLVNNSIFVENDLVAYVPLHMTEKKGIIRGVDTSYSETEIFEMIQSNVPVKSVRRLFRIIEKDGQKIKVPRQMVVVTFNRVELPQYIFMNKVRFEVNCYYSPVVMCYKCLRYGHTSGQCKSVQKCQVCGTITDEILENRKCSNSCSKYCIYCKEETHNSTDKSCPVYLKQKSIKECMAHLNISFVEAKKIADNPSYASLVTKNKFAPLLSSPEEFPELPNKANYFTQNRSLPSNGRRGSINSSPPSSSESNSKKRKVRDTSPNNVQVQREFPWSFGGKPIVNIDSPRKHNFEALKHQVMIGLSGYIDNFCKTLNCSRESQEVFENFTRSFNKLLIDLFENVHIQT